MTPEELERELRTLKGRITSLEYKVAALVQAIEHAAISLGGASYLESLKKEGEDGP